MKAKWITGFRLLTDNSEVWHVVGPESVRIEATSEMGARRIAEALNGYTSEVIIDDQARAAIAKTQEKSPQ